MMKHLDLLFHRKGRPCRVFWLALLLLPVLLFSAGNTFGQSEAILVRKITYKASKASLSKVLKDVRRQANIRFSYNSQLLERQKPVTIDVRDISLRDFLQQLFSNTSLAFTEEMGGILIYEKQPETATPATSTRQAMSVVLRGMVTDQQGAPLAGVSIHGGESKEMTMTTTDGLFMLVARGKETVYFTMQGMKPASYKALISNTELLTIKMDTLVQAMQEVVVNGYQKIDARMATGAYTKLDAEQVLQPGVASIDRMLQGKVPGLVVTNSSGSVNAKATMRIRGTSTLIGNAAPLIVVDGMIRPDPVNISSAVLNDLVSKESNANYELMGNAIAGVNPFDIESFTFLRDAAATAIYGARAANGIIVITTKRGKVGKMQVGYQANVSFQAIPTYRRLKLMNSKERVELSRQLEEDQVEYYKTQAGTAYGLTYEDLRYDLYGRRITEEEFNARIATLETRNTDWFKELFRNQVGTQQSLNVSGGVGKTTYYASLSFSANNGAAKLDGNKSYAANINLRSEIGRRLMLDLTLTSSLRKATGYFSGINPYDFAYQTSRTLSPEDWFASGAGISTGGAASDPFLTTSNAYLFNMRNEIGHSGNTTDGRSTTVNMGLDYKIGHGWYFRNLSNVALSDVNGFSYVDQYTTQVSVLRGWRIGETPNARMIARTSLLSGGIAYLNQSSSISWGLRNSLEYNKSLFHNRDQFNFNIGSEIHSEKAEGFTTKEIGYYPDRGQTFVYLTNSSNTQKMLTDVLNNSVSWYSTAAYNLLGRYILSTTIRTDGSNRFGQYSNSKFLPNYSVSGRWNMTAENWFPTKGILSDVQLRASMGTQGNVVDAVGPTLIATYTNTNVSTSTNLNPVTQAPYLSIKSLAYPDLRWEKTLQWNFGADLSLLNNRARLSIEYYTKRTTDALDMVEIPYEYGANIMYRNGSRLYNKGLEVAGMVVLLSNKKMNLSVNVITSRNIGQKDKQNGRDDFAGLFNGTGHLPGRPLSGFYSYIFTGLDHNTGIPTFDKMDLTEKTSDPNKFLVYSGQLDPKMTFTLGPTFTYKSFSFTSSLYLSVGASKRINPPVPRNILQQGVPAPYTNLPAAYLQRWRKPGDEVYTDIPVAINEVYSNFVAIPYQTDINASGTAITYSVDHLTMYQNSDRWVVKNNYLKCNYLNLSYGIPPAYLKSLGVKNALVGLSVNNAFTIANKRLNGQDPENANVGNSALPTTRQYALSLNVVF